MTASGRDAYRRIAAETRATLKIEKSEFIGIAIPVTTEAEFITALRKIEKELHGATHHCWAFRTGHANDLHSRSSDAGEPSGTAGKPILTAIESQELSDTAIVVVRYYGGVKLGTGGLARAYRDAAREALGVAPIEERILYDRLEVRTSFATAGVVYRLLDPPHIVLIDETSADDRVFILDVRKSRSEAVLSDLAEKRVESRRQTQPGLHPN